MLMNTGVEVTLLQFSGQNFNFGKSLYILTANRSNFKHYSFKQNIPLFTH